MKLRPPSFWRRARVVDWPPPAPPVHPIEQYGVLAFLLHVWVVLMFGSLQGGTARPGEGVWGSLTVSLVGLPGQGEAQTRSTDEGALAPVGRAHAGAIKPAALAATQAEPPAPAPAEALADKPADDLPPPQPPQPPQMEATVAPEPEVVPAPPPEAMEAEAQADPATAMALLSTASAALSLPPMGSAPVPVVALRPLPEMVRSQQRVPASVSAPALAASAVARVSPPALPVAAKPAAAEPLAPPPAPPPLPATAAATPPTPPPVAMRQLGAEAAPVLVRRPATSELLTPVQPLTRLPALQTLAAADRVGAARRPVVQGQPEATAAVSPGASGVAPGPASAQVSAAAPTPPASSAKLILELPRGGAMASQGVRGVLQMLPPPPERKSKLGDAIDKAAKTDCREAYQKNGLLAAVPLVMDAARDKGCQW